MILRHIIASDQVISCNVISYHSIFAIKLPFGSSKLPGSGHVLPDLSLRSLTAGRRSTREQ